MNREHIADYLRKGALVKNKGKYIRIIIISVLALIAGVAYCLLRNIGKIDNTIDYQLQSETAVASDSIKEAGVEESINDVTVTSIPPTNLPQSTIVVHVCGAVKQPGVYELQADSRISDAIEAAGGLTAENAADMINQAQKLMDGLRVYIPNIEETGEIDEADRISGTEAVSTDSSLADDNSDTESKNTLVNINTADEEELMTLVGIGLARAKSIIAYREKNGSFESTEQIMLVSGIKSAAYEKICDAICVK